MGVLHQVEQELELAVCQIQGRSVFGRKTLLQVDSKGPTLDDGRFLAHCLGASHAPASFQGILCSLADLFGPGWLEEIRIHTFPDGNQGRIEGCVSGQDDRRRVRPSPLGSFQHPQAVDPSAQPQVQDGEIKGRVAKELQRLLTAGRSRHAMADLLQGGRQEEADPFVVVND